MARCALLSPNFDPVQLNSFHRIQALMRTRMMRMLMRMQTMMLMGMGTRTRMKTKKCRMVLLFREKSFRCRRRGSRLLLARPHPNMKVRLNHFSVIN